MKKLKIKDGSIIMIKSVFTTTKQEHAQFKHAAVLFKTCGQQAATGISPHPAQPIAVAIHMMRLCINNIGIFLKQYSYHCQVQPHAKLIHILPTQDGD